MSWYDLFRDVTMIKKQTRYYLRPGEGRQLRFSVDTEIGYRGWKESKSESFRGGEADGSGLEFSAVAG